MAELPYPWSIYAQLQSDLQQRDRIDDKTWGLEAQLNRLLRPTPAPDDVRRAGESESRKERHRAKLRRTYGFGQSVEETFESALFAREQLCHIRETLSAPDWDLLTDVAAGVSYEELAASIDTTAGALRVRTYRLRLLLRAA